MSSIPLPSAKRARLRVTHDPKGLWNLTRRLIGTWTGPVAMATQRSSFLLWDAATLEPVTELISWQDTRAASWCAFRREAGPFVRARTGLVLSPHYIGPKLAELWIERPDLRARALKGELRLGTLDTFFTALMSKGRLHVMDSSQAQRTSLWNLEKAQWDRELLGLFGVPENLLPCVGEGPWNHERGEILCLLADQSAAALGLDTRVASILVNLGTGGFVLSRSVIRPSRKAGLLLSHLGGRGGSTPWMAEGTVNGISTTFSLSSVPEGSLCGDPSLPAFCLPDFGAVGAPWWRAGVGPLFSPAVSGFQGDAFRNVLAEGLAYRVREILGALPEGAGALLSGGLSRDPSVRSAFQRLVPRKLFLAEDPELTLRGLLQTCHVPQSQLGCTPMSRVSDSWMDRRFQEWGGWTRQALG